MTEGPGNDIFVAYIEAVHLVHFAVYSRDNIFRKARLLGYDKLHYLFSFPFYFSIYFTTKGAKFPPLLIK